MVGEKKSRIGIDGTPCKRYWYHGSQLIAGCTTLIDPEGNSGNEWC